LTDSPAATPYPYAYPTSHSRKHGPEGYLNYDSYRDWLRDEFAFRCVYCLFREQWGRQTASWDLDHWVPQAIESDLELSYENLLYACASCNSVKGDRRVPNPTNMDLSAAVEVDPNGVIRSKNKQGQILIKIMRLDNDDYTRFRAMIIRTVNILADQDRDVYRLWMGYPTDLPDLSKLRPTRNTRPDGVNNSFFALRARQELEDVY